MQKSHETLCEESRHEPVRIVPLSLDNFHEDSLDGFIRHQEVHECWRCESGQWELRPIAFTEDWHHADLRKQAADILHGLQSGYPAVGAFAGDSLIGFATLGQQFGRHGQYIELVSYHVSSPWRGHGIGRQLFGAICDAARACGAGKLYISAHSSKESQAAYRALGCGPAEEIDAVRAEREPDDVQMEYLL